ncbi:MAG: hypothetical protein Fur0024_3120 [Patescibacteria group bacterium]
MKRIIYIFGSAMLLIVGFMFVMSANRDLNSKNDLDYNNFMNNITQFGELPSENINNTNSNEVSSQAYNPEEEKIGHSSSEISTSTYEITIYRTNDNKEFDLDEGFKFIYTEKKNLNLTEAKEIIKNISKELIVARNQIKTEEKEINSLKTHLKNKKKELNNLKQQVKKFSKMPKTSSNTEKLDKINIEISTKEYEISELENQIEKKQKLVEDKIFYEIIPIEIKYFRTRAIIIAYTKKVTDKVKEKNDTKTEYKKSAIKNLKIWSEENTSGKISLKIREL